MSPIPQYAENLQKSYGGPSECGFGSAVFFASNRGVPGSMPKSTSSLETTALMIYQKFCGELWNRFGEAAWMSSWEKVYQRDNTSRTDSSGDFLSEIRSIRNPAIHGLLPMLIDEIEDSELAKKHLAEAFDSPEVREVAVYSIGDGAAMSGLIVASDRINGERICLILLLD